MTAISIAPGGPLVNPSPVRPTDLGCLHINRAWVAEANRRRWLAEDRCPTCGTVPEDDTLILCVGCTEKGWR